MTGSGRLPLVLGHPEGHAQFCTYSWQCAGPAFCIVPMPSTILDDEAEPKRCQFMDTVLGMPVVAMGIGKFWALLQGRLAGVQNKDANAPSWDRNMLDQMLQSVM